MITNIMYDYKYNVHYEFNLRNVAVSLEDGLGPAPMLLSQLNDLAPRLPVY